MSIYKLYPLLPFLVSELVAEAARLASLLSWLALSFCFFLLVLTASSGPLWPRLRPDSLGPVLLLAIFSHLPLMGRLSPTSLPLPELLPQGSGSELCRFLPGPAILAAFQVRALPEENQRETVNKKQQQCMYHQQTLVECQYVVLKSGIHHNFFTDFFPNSESVKKVSLQILGRPCWQISQKTA